MVRDYVPVVGTVGVLLYGLFRLAYLFFYLRLRTTPEEVGYDYARLLAVAAGGAVELAILCGGLFVVVTSAYAAARLAPAVVRRRGRRSSWRAVLRILRRNLRRIAIRCIVAGAATSMLSLPALAYWQGGLAQRGQTVRNVYIFGLPALPVLAVTAVPADVAWVDGDTGKPLLLTERICLMYLGESNGVTVLYDVGTRESLRIPSDRITVTLRYTFWVPDECR